MESKVTKSSKSTKIAKRRSKPSIVAQELPKRRKLRARRMAAVDVDQMKENSTSTSEIMMMTDDPRLQKHFTQLACKENLIEHSEGLGTSVHATVGPLRPRLQQQQLTLYQQLQPHPHLEPERESAPDPSLDVQTPKNSAPSVFPSHFQPRARGGHYLRTTPRPLPPQHPCKLKFGHQVMYDTGLSTSPLPQLKWARSADMWWTMRSKDVTKATPEAALRLHHPEILPSMRIILLDWMMEVCEEYKLHRETYYLAMDMFDRFMDARTNIRKEQLQLLGVTCLFISAKIEEIYPPKAADFAYVTDGACSVADLLDTELIVCKVLEWRLNHNVVTASTWVNTYMQLGSHHLRPAGVKAKEFEFPAYSSVEFPKVMKLLDLCSLDVVSRKFGSSVLAASSLYLQSERSRANLAVTTGFELREIQACVNWMYPFAVVLSQKVMVAKKAFPGVAPHDTHNIQTHNVSISMLEDSVELRCSQEASCPQYSLLQDCSVMMTPPRNERRCLAPINTTC